ncbi:MAG: WxcM-like domain-containing protein [Chitinivibrionales bacterium]|nr:WxcM-like domain-containing protein [Chitinivibrionales bacterium]
MASQPPSNFNPDLSQSEAQPKQQVMFFNVATAKKFSQDSVPTVSMIRSIESRGPWKTKSDAELSVLCALPYDVVRDYFTYDTQELEKIPCDIRGLRSYRVRGITPGNSGANEFHRIRKEMLFSLNGEIEVTCEDLFGKTQTFQLNAERGIFIPPFIIHTYYAKTLADILVIANTLFIPENPATHDTYSREIFTELQKTFLHPFIKQ